MHTVIQFVKLIYKTIDEMTVVLGLFLFYGRYLINRNYIYSYIKWKQSYELVIWTSPEN